MHSGRRWTGMVMGVVGLLVGCGSSTPSSTSTPDSATGATTDAAATTPDAPATADGNVPMDTASTFRDAESADANARDANTLDGRDAVTVDSSPAPTDAPTDLVSTTEDAPADAAFVPGPATAVVVNSSNTAKYAVSDGTWQLFYFDAVAAQIYAVSGLGGIVTGYIGTTAQVSPSNYQFKTNADGVVSFTAATAARYYVAVAASGGGATGSFQVADGGTLLALGATVLSLAAPDGDNTYFYRFPITAGHGYVLDAQGPSQPNVGIAVSPRAERSTNGQFSYSAWGVAGSLPFSNQAISATSVAQSYSGYYYFYVNAKGAITLTVAISEAP